MQTRLKLQLEFILQIDRLKGIERQTLLTDKSRRETDAEHSWHLAMMAVILHEYADRDNVDLLRVIKMALIHDLVEIYAGDTFAFDRQANRDKEAREKAAAERLFSRLPEDQCIEFKALWQEFEQMRTADAQYAAALDRLQPFLNNTVTDGHTWKLGNVTRRQALERIGIVRQSVPALWGFVESAIEDAISRGYISE